MLAVAPAWLLHLNYGTMAVNGGEPAGPVSQLHPLFLALRGGRRRVDREDRGLPSIPRCAGGGAFSRCRSAFSRHGGVFYGLGVLFLVAEVLFLVWASVFPMSGCFLSSGRAFSRRGGAFSDLGVRFLVTGAFFTVWACIFSSRGRSFYEQPFPIRGSRSEVFNPKTIFDRIYRMNGINEKGLGPKAQENFRTVCIPHNRFCSFC